MVFWSLSGAHNSGSKQIDDDDGNEDMWVFSHDLPLPQLPTRILKDLGCTIHYMFIHFHCTIYIHVYYTVLYVSQCEQQVALKCQSLQNYTISTQRSALHWKWPLHHTQAKSLTKFLHRLVLLVLVLHWGELNGTKLSLKQPASGLRWESIPYWV